MHARDPLWRVEQAVLADELASTARHDVRNRLASIRNASFYIRRRLSRSELWSADPRLAEFLQLIDDEVQLATQGLEQGNGSGALFERRLRVCELSESLVRARRLARIPETMSVSVTVDAAAPAAVEADPDELALCLRLLIEHAAASAGASLGIATTCATKPGDISVSIRTSAGDAGLVTAADAPPSATSEGHDPALAWSLALRIATRNVWSLERRDADGGPSTWLEMPLAAPGHDTRDEETKP